MYEDMTLDEIDELVSKIIRLETSSKDTLRAIANERFAHSPGSVKAASRVTLIRMIQVSVSNERALDAIERLASKPLPPLAKIQNW